MDEWMRQQLLASLDIAHEQFQRREAIGWLVMSWDRQDVEQEGVSFGSSIVGCYGPFASPEEALVECGKHDNSSQSGFENVIVPLYPPVEWKEKPPCG
jgi:hypothetical protein